MGVEAGSRCRRGEDKDVSTSHAMSGAHDKSSGRRESRREIRSGAWKLLEIKEMPRSAEIEQAPVRMKGSRWISRIAGKVLLGRVPTVRGGAKSLPLIAIYRS